MKIGGPIEACEFLKKNNIKKMAFPPMKIGGPIEAYLNSEHEKNPIRFPPMKIGGPIEAFNLLINMVDRSLFPPMKIGGPIEASPRIIQKHPGVSISADENRRPH